MNLWHRKLRSILPIVLRELSFLALWLMATPAIDNYLAVERIFEPVWYSSLSAGFIIRWFILLRGIKTPPFLRWVYKPAVIPLVVLWGLVLCGEIRIINAYYPFVLVIMGGLAFYLHRSHRLHGWTLNIALLLLFSLTLYYRLFPLTAIYTGLYVLFALGGILFRRNIYSLPAWVVSMALMNLLVAFFLFHFRFVTGEHLDRVSRHPGVERLFVYHESDPVSRMIGKNIMVIQEACEPDKYLIGSHHGGAGLVLIDRNTNEAYVNPHIKACSNDILVDCVTHEAVAGDFTQPGGVYSFDLKNWPNLCRAAIPIPGPVVYIVYDRVNNLYLVFPKDRVIFAVDASTGEVKGSLRGPDERAYDPRSNELTTLTEPDFSIMRLKTVDREGSPFEILQRRSLGVPLYKRLQMYFHPGPTEGKTLVTDLWEGTVTLYGRDLEPLRRTRIAPGVSAMALTHDKQYLLVGGYTDGNLYFLSMKTWEVVTSLYLGHRMRELRLSRDGRYAYVGTSQGGFRIDLALILGELASEADKGDLANR